MMWLLIATVTVVSVTHAQKDRPAPTTASSLVTPIPSVMGDFFRPYFWEEHPNLCGRLPEIKVTNPKNLESWEYYRNINDKPHLIYLAEAQCGTCQSNAAIAGQLSKVWSESQRGMEDKSVDMDVFVFNRDSPASAKKFNMMRNRLNNRFHVGQWVSLHQDNGQSGVWNSLADYWVDNTGPHKNETSKFRSQRNDMYLVDQWGRMVRFLRDAILNRSRKDSADTNILWRDVVHDVMVSAKNRMTVCDELQRERLYCRVPGEWQLDGVSFESLRRGKFLTILVFIRADMAEFTNRGVLRDFIDLSRRWKAPRYVVVVDSVPQSKEQFSAIRMYGQNRNRDVQILQDNDNMVTSKFLAAPGDLFAVDSVGRIVGLIDRVNLRDRSVEEQLRNWYLSWNPECEAFLNTA